MEGFVKGDIIVIEYPYSDFKTYKRRPVVVLKVPKGEDIIVLQMTAESQEKSVEILITYKDFSKGRLKREGFIRLDKVFTIDKSLVKYKVGSLKQEMFNNIVESLCNYLKTD